MNGLLIVVGIILLTGAIIGFARGAVRILVSLATTVVTIVIVFYTLPYVSQALSALTPLDEVIQGRCMSAIEEVVVGDELPRTAQIEAIENAELPEVFKELLLTNNNDEVYDLLGVTTFVEYFSGYLTKIIIDIISFLLTFLVVTIVIRAIVFALDFVTSLPVLGILNRLSGVLVGTSISMIVVWILFVGITLIYASDTGKMLMGMIMEEEILLFLYENNPVLKLITMLR